VVGIASNGREAVDLAASLRPDIITMDFEMPVMDGITAIRHILAQRQVPILMFSSLTYEGARVTLDALAAGAMDFIPKDFAEVSRSSDALTQKLHERLVTLALAGQRSLRPQSPALAALRQSRLAAESAGMSTTITSRASAIPLRDPVHESPIKHVDDDERLKKRPKVIVIGASTGGPVALGDVLMGLPANFPLPIVLVQHMPENFTRAFAERLNKQCQITVREAADGELLQPGVALLAPGGKQMMLDKRLGGSVRILPDDERVNYKPSLDITFGSAANTYADRVLGIVLTGMGSDGCKGAGLLKQAGSSIWSQDEASCVIYGMPMAVAKANLTDKVLSLRDIGPRLVREVM